MVCQDCRSSAVAGALQRGRSCVGHLRGLISCGEEVLIRTAPSPGSWQLRGAKLLLEKRGELCSCGFVVQFHPWKHDSTGCDGQRWVTWGLLWQKLYVREKRSKRRWRWAWWWAGKGRGLLVWACLVAWCLAMRRNGLAGQPDEGSLGKLCSPLSSLLLMSLAFWKAGVSFCLLQLEDDLCSSVSVFFRCSSVLSSEWLSSLQVLRNDQVVGLRMLQSWC